MKTLSHGDRNDRVRAVQAATNRRLRARDLERLTIEEDGELGARSLAAIRMAARMLGAQKTTYDAVTDKGTVPVGVQRMILNPGRRTAEQRRRGEARVAHMRAARKRRSEARKREEREHGGSARSRTVNAFLAKVGTREQPSGSNGGGLITVMETFYGFGRVPWCGISAGYHAEKFGGVNLASDVASVAAIERHARAGHEPYGKWQSDPRGAFPGALVVIGGSGVHVGMLVEALSDGSAKTVEGNTSFSNRGSQSNGGCIAARVRSPREITGVATMNYPKR
jgi:hypothetical protein